MRRWIFGMSAVVGTTALVLACSVGTDCDFGQCPGVAAGGDSAVGGEGGLDTGMDGAVVPPGCKPELDPKDSAPCVVNDYGVFVSPTGKADAAGTREAPINSITNALKKLGNKPRIYVCKGAYTETIDLSSPVAIYGGFACDTWMYSGDKPSITAANPGEYALRIRGITAPVTVADLSLTAKPGDATNVSSIAAFVSDSPAVTLRRVTLTAKDGLGGGSGQGGATGTLLAPETNLNGNNPELAGVGKGGLTKACACSSGGTSKGGRGGDLTGTVDGAAGETKMMTSEPPTATGEPSTQATCTATNTSGLNGSNAPTPNDAVSPTSVGTIVAAGWKPSDGAPGDSGKPGQGGGGAGSKTTGASPGGGGAGACGGCGGTGGGGGSAGGSSIALLTLNSPVRFEACVLLAGKGGNGGSGALGGMGEMGGFGGFRGGSCSGGDGGRGADGAAGAGGSGGLSAGILYVNGTPITDGATEAAITIGTGGEKGTGGRVGANDGKAGEAKKIYAL